MTALRMRQPLLAGITLVVAAFMIAPMGLTFASAFVANHSVGFASGFTLDWLAQVWSDYGATVWLSLAIAAACVALDVVLGVPCAYLLARTRSRWAGAFEELLTLPVAVPGLATALALLLTYGRFGTFRQSAWFILVGHVVFTLPFLVRTVAAALRRDELLALEEAARTLGAGFARRFVGVLVPAVLPAIVAGSLMAFTLSIGEFNLTWMLHTPLTRTLPVGLADSYASMRLEYGSAYTVIFFAVILPVLWALQVVARQVQRHYGN